MASSTSPTPSYHLCPDFSIAPPSDGHLTLGSILLSLDNEGVSQPLNTNKTVSIPEDQIFPRSGPDSKYGFTRSLRELKSIEASIWARVANIISLRLGLLRNVTDDETLTVDDIQTRYFTPDEDYMLKSLQNIEVVRFITMTKKKLPLFMVTGLKIAVGAQLTKARGNTTTVNAQAGVTDPQGTASGGGTAGYTNEGSASMAFDGSSPFVLGIRVRKIWWERDSLKTSDTVAGATLGDEGRLSTANLANDAKFADDFLFDESATFNEIFVNEDLLGVEPSTWVIMERNK